MMHRPTPLMTIVLLLALLLFNGFNRTATAEEDRSPEKAIAALDVADGLEATLFASEPMMYSPTNIDIDHRGRVWVMEVVNYRSKKGSRLEGDRILVLEDTDGDGRADSETVFYQGTDIDGGMGICVLGNRVIVTASPKVFVFTDVDGDLKADKKELLFTKTGQELQHDHSAHAFTFGPDGKLYWNFGNTGKHVHDKDGNLVVDIAGHEVVDNGKPYRGGMVFRCNLDGTEFEVLGHNFRNNYEVAVDSFGTLWQSDNDDDGNRSVRINYVMEHGNFGYRDEITGAGWRIPRTGMHFEIPKRHWHLNDPGVVPNVLQTGAGSPTGIVLYEGNLLPKIFRNQMIHCDAGPNVVRAYPVENEGAGYKARMVNILHGARDQWFRPADVCVAPDGSLIVADWYDPGVGGHRMGDVERGRLFRIAPPNTPYRVPEHNFSTTEGAIAALKSPNLATRYLAWTALHSRQAEAESDLAAMFRESDNPHHRARALWLLGKISGRGEHYVQQAIADSNSDIRITGIRLARHLKQDVIPVVERLVKDKSPQVRRECAIALRGQTSDDAVELWVRLALQHNGNDRWYLEALGIGAAGNWDARFERWLDRIGEERHNLAGRDIVWRSRAEHSARYLAVIILLKPPSAAVLRYLRAFDFIDFPEKETMLGYLAFHEVPTNPPDVRISVEAMKRLKPFKLADKPEKADVFEAVFQRTKKNGDFVLLVDRFDVQSRFVDLMNIAANNPNSELGSRALTVLLNKRATKPITDSLNHKDEKVVAGTLAVLGNAVDPLAAELILSVLTDVSRSIQARREAVSALGKSPTGAARLIKVIESGNLGTKFKQAAAAGLHASADATIRARALKLFPPPPGKDNKPLPPVAQLVKRTGEVIPGKIIFNTTGTCLKCHQVNGVGKEVGPNLSEIGSKLGKHELYNSILFPSAGISHNYETHLVLLEKGTILTGLITSRTPDEITLTGADAIPRTIKTSEIEEIIKQNVSLMPADLQKLLTDKELVNVIEYLTTLKKPNP